MKLIIVLAWVLGALSAKSQPPQYFENNPVWSCSNWNYNQPLSGSSPFEEHFNYYLSSDTILLGITYHKVHRRGYRDSLLIPGQINLVFDEPTGYYVRQVGRTIRFSSLSISDSLLISYDYSVGDTVKGHIFSEFGSDTIQKIDSVFINTEYRKVFYLDSINGPVITEGIGHQLSINQNLGEVFLPEWQGIGYSNHIHCYGQNEVPYWDSNESEGDCILNADIPNLSLSKKTLIKITDLFGRTVKQRSNTVLIYLYSDGSTEKVFIVD